MKVKVISLILVSLFVLNLNGLAREIQEIPISKPKKITKKKNPVENVDSIKLVADSLLQELRIRDSVLYANNKLVEDKTREQDSLLSVIRDKDNEITKLRAHYELVDKCMIRLLNRWLNEPFNKEDVLYAIEMYDKIYSEELKKKYSKIQDLLKNYESAYKTLQKILKDAQYDINRKNPLDSSCELYRKIYIKQIEEMDYYKNYYNGFLNILYLNKQIDKALEILRNHSSENPADFSHLID